MGLPLLPLIQVGVEVAGGIGAMNAAAGEKQRADINAYVGETRAMQTGTVARQNLESELSSIRSAFAANGNSPSSETFNLLSGVREVRGRERQINVDNQLRGAMDSRIAGQNAVARGQGAFFGSIGSAAPSIFSLAQLYG